MSTVAVNRLGSRIRNVANGLMWDAKRVKYEGRMRDGRSGDVVCSTNWV
jgi:hypothetical protein